MAHHMWLVFLLCCARQTTAVGPESKSIPLDLSRFYNNKAFGTYPGEAAFDNKGQSYPVPSRENTPHYTSATTGIEYSFPGYAGPKNFDNVVCAGQKIIVPQTGDLNRAFSASFLVSGDVENVIVEGNTTFEYVDGSVSTFQIRSLDWFSFLTINRGEIIFPYRFTADGVNRNTSNIFERTAPLEPGKKLKSITLPDTQDADAGRMHVFAISLWGGAPHLGVQSIRPTQKWLEADEQLVEVTINNAGDECVSGHGLTVSLIGEGVVTTTVGHVKRLCPGDQKIVKLGVRGHTKGPVDVTVVVQEDVGHKTFHTARVEFGLTTWTTDLDNLARHEAPDWFDGAKFGMFIHWGPYAVPGWGNSTPYESYGEWFWWYTTHHPLADRSDFYDYRLRTFGPNWAYDDGFADFTGSKFDPKEWVDLFADAGAQYFVITTKHHDGFALFDTGDTTHRSALHYGPKRDILRELFDAAAKYQPKLRRGTYFSLPEWFNPDFGPYGYDQNNETTTPGTNSWLGIPAKNPYTGRVEPYTGRLPIKDFLQDLMLPQMQTLARDYETDIMWCDVGAANVTAEFAATWWNEARRANRQVTINSRCGIAHAADFDTPEYQIFASAQARKWESNMGMDPFSYGYNRATAPEDYMNATTLVTTLVDIVSKNGNFLLDVGPRADGTIVEAEVNNLREAGKWIRSHGEALYNTTYWFVQPQVTTDKIDVRFTQTDEAFYLLFLEKPVVKCGVIEVPAPIPILKGDKISMLNVHGAENLSWDVTGKGDQAVLSIRIREEFLDKDSYCWVFKIEYA